MPDAISPDAARWMRRWLILIGLMVYAMILIGGATRLHRFWPLDHGMATDHGGFAAARRSGLAGRV